MDSCFDKIQRWNTTLYIHKDFRNDTFEQALLDSEKELRECYQLTTIRSSRFARVYRLAVRFDDIDKEVYFKQYLCRSIWDFIKDFVRASRAERAFKATEMLSESGFDTPTIIARGKFRYGLCHTTNFLVTLEIEDAKQIYQFIPDNLEDLTEGQLRSKRELIRAFGRTIGHMHAAGIFHGDLRLGNVLARQEKNSWRFFFLDNERTKKFYRLPARLRLKNLVQINMWQSGIITNTDRMRFFNAYLCKNADIQKCRKYWAQKTIRKTDFRLSVRKDSQIDVCKIVV